MQRSAVRHNPDDPAAAPDQGSDGRSGNVDCPFQPGKIREVGVVERPQHGVAVLEDSGIGKLDADNIQSVMQQRAPSGDPPFEGSGCDGIRSETVPG
ncbi:MAG: hypothetical protein A2078_11575 [Nitrospirae bacterium GWC2_57_9]|nr:MAG: hypothetical protein A2078_11575 [Nitrospirae bacterium GWC2_57_9]